MKLSEETECLIEQLLRQHYDTNGTKSVLFDFDETVKACRELGFDDTANEIESDEEFEQEKRDRDIPHDETLGSEYFNGIKYK